MSGVGGLPERVLKLIHEKGVAEFATVSQAGVPIDTPCFHFPNDEMSVVGVATGLSYPAKAERARRNPKVGLLIEGTKGEPVVAIRGRAAVRDADLQANVTRYLSEAGYFDDGFQGHEISVPWTSACKAVWYWTRILIDIAPERILWWDNRAAMDGPPRIWNAPAGTVFPPSDPRPRGEVSPSSQWPQRTWQDMARDAVKRRGPAHITLCDDDGYPLSVRVRDVEIVEDGFTMIVPRGMPFSGAGKACLTFEGVETFVGDATTRDGNTHFTVERPLPEHPLLRNPAEVLQPTDAVRGKLMARLEEETRRRGQPIPVIPEVLPACTAAARLRQNDRAWRASHRWDD